MRFWEKIDSVWSWQTASFGWFPNRFLVLPLTKWSRVKKRPKISIQNLKPKASTGLDFHRFGTTWLRKKIVMAMTSPIIIHVSLYQNSVRPEAISIPIATFSLITSQVMHDSRIYLNHDLDLCLSALFPVIYWCFKLVFDFFVQVTKRASPLFVALCESMAGEACSSQVTVSAVRTLPGIWPFLRCARSGMLLGLVYSAG